MNILKKRILIGFAAMLLVFSQTSLFVYGQSETEDSTKGENTSVTQSEKELAELSLLEQAAQYGQSNGQTAKIIGVDEPFIIGSAEALAELSELILDHAEYGEDMNFAQAKYKLVADIDLSGIGNWIPIGKYTGPTYTAPFEGHFDGNGHVIRNMTIQSMDDNDIQIYAGLFGVMGENGTIENIVLENVNVDGREYLGGLVGYNMGTINNVSVTGNVTGSSEYIGGLVGQNYEGSINNCSANVSVEGSGAVGGLVGENNAGSMNSCSVTGDIVKGYNNVGGLAGISYEGAIYNSHAVIDIEGTDNVGGLVGYDAKIISNSYASGNVIGKANDIGGLIGYTNGGTIINSYATGNVTGAGEYVGGLAGHISGISHGAIRNSYATGDVFGKKDYVGGLAGFSDTEIHSCYATGNVTGIGDYVGGLIGDFGGHGEIYHCIALNPSVSGSNYVAKVIGQNDSDSAGNLYSWSNMKVTHNDSDDGENGTDITFDAAKGFSLDWNTMLGDTDAWENTESTNIPTLKNVPGTQYNGVSEHIQYDGTNLDTNIYINHLSDLIKFRDDVNSGNEYTGKTLVLTSDIDMSSISNWTPIGTERNKFNGTFDGNGHIIENMVIQSSEDNVGLFGYMELGGIIKNIGLKNVSIKGNENVGGLLGAGNGTIHNCYVTGNIIGNASVGALTGYMTNSGEVSDSYFTGSVTGENTIGGLVGYNNGEINNSYIKGSVDGIESNIGGLAGYSNGNISNCYVEGNVSGMRGYIGGLVGKSSGSICDSYMTGNVYGKRDCIGGLVGEIENSATICNSHSNANVEGLGDYIGGLVGYVSSGSIYNSYATGDVTGGRDAVGGIAGFVYYLGNIHNSYATGNVTGKWFVGGVAGGHDGEIKDSYALGNVTGEWYVGGLAGNNSGKISNSYTLGSVTGGTYVGGITGEMSDSGSIQHSAALTPSVSGSSYVGRVVGHNNGSVMDCYGYNHMTVTQNGSDSGENGTDISYDAKNGFSVDWKTIFNDTASDFWENMDHKHIPTLIGTNSTQSGDIPEHIKHSSETDAAANI